MLKAIAVLFMCGCSDVVQAPDEPDTKPPAEECSLPNVGPAPRLCASNDECFWSQCSMSTCIKGKCVHEKRVDGAACGDPGGLIGTCDECLCTIET